MCCKSNHTPGSIGVFGMIPNLQNFYKNKIGISIDTVNTHKSDIGINRALTEFERKKFKRSRRNIQHFYI